MYLIEGVFDWLTAVSWRLAAFSTCGTDFPFDRLGWLAAGRGRLRRAGRATGRARSRGAVRRSFRSALAADCPARRLDLNDLGRRPDGRALFFRLVADGAAEMLLTEAQ